MCSVETICVPVTLLSLLHCLPLLRRLAAGQSWPVEEAPFQLEVCAAPAQRSRRLGSTPAHPVWRPALTWPSPSPETVCIYYFGV